MANTWNANATKAGTYTFSTAGKFVDRDITLKVPTAGVNWSSSLNITIPDNNYTTLTIGDKDDNGGYPLELKHLVQDDTLVTVNTAGWVTAGNKSIDLGGKITTNGVTLPAAVITPSASGTATISTVAVGSKSGSTYPITGSGTGTGLVNANVDTEGYAKSEYEDASASFTVNGKVNATIPAAVVTKGTTVTNGSVATRGAYSLSDGYIANAEGDLAAAAFKNAGTSGTTYVDISETEDAPILISGDYLYIDSGYVDNLKISLARLVPDLEGYTMGGAADMRSGKTLYDKDGKPVTGTIADSTTTKTNGTATATATTTPNLGTGTYTTTATSGYTYSVKANATANTTAAKVTASVGYVASAVSASTSAATKTASQTVYLLDSTSKVGTTALASGGTISAGSTLTIGKGYYPTDRTFTAQTAGSALNTSNITGTLTGTITDGYTLTLLDSAPTSGKYITLTGNGTMTTGDIFSGTATAKTQYIEVYNGTYSVG